MSQGLGCGFTLRVKEGHADWMTFGTRRRQEAWAQSDLGSQTRWSKVPALTP